MSKTLRANVKAAIEEKAANKRNELETKLGNVIEAYNALVKKTSEDCKSKFEPIIREIVTNFFTNNPDIVVEDKTMHLSSALEENKVIKTKEDVQNELIARLYLEFLLYLDAYTNSAQIKECKKALKDFNKLVEETAEEAISTIESKINNKQIRDILNKFIFE